MNETRKYLDHLTQTTADTITGEILERVGNGVYRYRDVGSGAERFATANLQDEFAIGSRVRIDRPSASRSVVGSQDVIVNRAPREQRGLSGTTPAVDVDGFDRAVVISVDPDPLVLTAGGEPGEQTITGSGFAGAAEYFGRGADLPDPDLTDAEAPTVAATSVVMTISAAGDSALGDFDVVVSGARAPKALRILPPEPVTLEFGFFVVGLGNNATKLVAVRDFDAAATPIESEDLGATISEFYQLSNTEYLVFFTTGAARLLTIDAATGAFTASPTGTHPTRGSSTSTQVAYRVGLVYYGNDDGEFVEVNATNGTTVRVLRTFAGFPVFLPSCYHAGTDSLFTATGINGTGSGETGVRLRKLDRVTGAETVLLIGDGLVPRVQLIAAHPDGTSIVALRNKTSGTPSILFSKYDAATMTLIDETTAITGTIYLPQSQLLTSGGFVFAPIYPSATSIRAVLRTPDDMNGADAFATGSAVTMGRGAAIVPGDFNPWEVNALIRSHGIGSEFAIRVHDAHAADDADYITPLETRTFSLLAAESSKYGIGFTAAS